MSEAPWREVNRANWDERVALHLRAPCYDLRALREGRGRLHPIEEAELGPVLGKRVLHLQCHFGRDTLTLAQRGADVVGLDFSGEAIAAARALAAELGLAAHFVQADLYDAPAALGEAASFDLVFVTWGALCWLPDIARWARVVAHFLKPGGVLYLAEGHPVGFVFVFPDGAETPSRPGFFAPYFLPGSLLIEDGRDYADPDARMRNARTYQFNHTLGAVVSALIGAGLRLEFLHEHDRVPWRMFGCLVEEADGMYRWPEKPWLPLAFSLRAVR